MKDSVSKNKKEGWDIQLSGEYLPALLGTQGLISVPQTKQEQHQEKQKDKTGLFSDKTVFDSRGCQYPLTYTTI